MLEKLNQIMVLALQALEIVEDEEALQRWKTHYMGRSAPLMQTFRAYLQDAAGRVTWAAWIDAAGLDEAIRKARDLCGQARPLVEVWSATDRRPAAGCQLDPV